MFKEEEADFSGDFPYFYLRKYALFAEKSLHKKILVFSDEKNNTICCKTWKNKFLSFIQPVYPPLNSRAGRLSPENEKKFLDSFISFLREKKKFDRITSSENFSVFYSVPSGSKNTPFGTYYLDLHPTEEKLFSNLHPKHRNVIRNAERNNINVTFGKENIKNFHILYKETMARSSMYCEPIEYFTSFYDSLPENVICGVAYCNHVPQGALFMPFTAFGTFYLYGASAGKQAVNGAMNYLHWKAMLYLKSKGVQRYDFVGARLSDVSGTKLAGIQQFKERFGASLEKGFLWKLDLHKTKCNLYDSILKAKVKLKGHAFPKDIIDQENDKIYA